MTMEEEERLSSPFYPSSMPATNRVDPHGHRFIASEPSSDGLIGEGEFRKAFEQIANSLHLDGDEEMQCDSSPKGKTTVPDLNSPSVSSPTVSRISLTPKSSPNTVSRVVGTPVTPASSPLYRSQQRTLADPNVHINCPLPLSSLSFLDDDWLKERVKHDSKMAQVAGGLVRTASITPPAEAYTSAPSYYASSNVGGGHAPPGDYVCKLCNIPGHWLKDCHLFEPRGPSSQLGTRSATTTKGSSQSGAPSMSKIQIPPPGNYVCRLCGVPGHWIEQCAKFQPKKDLVKSGAGGIPPKNYICNLCHQPGHWIQHCSEFTPMPNHHHQQQHRRSNSMERSNSRFF